MHSVLVILFILHHVQSIPLMSDHNCSDTYYRTVASVPSFLIMKSPRIHFCVWPLPLSILPVTVTHLLDGFIFLSFLWLSSIPSYGHTTVVDMVSSQWTFGFSQMGLSRVKLLYTALVSAVYQPRSKSLGHNV